MAELHDTHPGITLMKAVARGLVRWPGLDTGLEQMVNLVNHTRNPVMHHLKQFCIPGSTQSPRGQGYMWIMLGHFLVGCI